jgi:hypothetical protein
MCYIKHTSKLHEQQSGGFVEFFFWCAGCKEPHSFRTKSPVEGVPMWTFNGNLESPTFMPSLLYRRNLMDYPGCGPRCHLFLKNGKIEYLDDCEHNLKGQVVDMVDYKGHE